MGHTNSIASIDMPKFIVQFKQCNISCYDSTPKITEARILTGF